MYLNASQTWTAAWLLSTALLVAGAVQAHRHYARAGVGGTWSRMSDVRPIHGAVEMPSRLGESRRAPARTDVAPRARAEALTLLFLIAQGGRASR